MATAYPAPEPPAEPLFPPGARTTAIPSAFFAEILPAIDDTAELLVTLYAFYLHDRTRPNARWFTREELRAEAPLIRVLARFSDDTAEALTRGLEAARRRGTLLRRVLHRDERKVAIYALNVPGAAVMLDRLGAESLPADAEPVAAGVVANIFLLYEENIGVVSPLLSERLREAEARYPWPWIEAAFREAVALNRRNWRYIERILERWETEGPDVEALRRTAESQGRRSLAGRYWRHVRR
jgi:DNA replication protein